MAQFQQWFADARSAEVLDPNAMSIATVDGAGQPSLRVVLLKYFGSDGFVFFTNLESRKSQELGANPRIAALFYWAELSRQVRITGRTTRTTLTENLRYFSTRPRDSQLGAWVSDQSRAISSRGFLESRFAEIRARFADGEVPLPSAWGGYRILPESFEFWQARENRLHDRYLYSPAADGWSITQLAP